MCIRDRVGLAAGFTVAFVSIQLRDLGRTERPVATVFWFAVVGTVLTAPILPFVHTPHSLPVWLTIAGIGISGTVTQILLSASLRYGQVASVIVMDYTALIWTTLYGEWLFRQPPPASTWIGAPLVLAAGLIIARREQLKARAVTGAPGQA